MLIFFLQPNKQQILAIGSSHLTKKKQHNTIEQGNETE